MCGVWWLLGLALGPLALWGGDFHVAAHGSDQDVGTRQAPFATLTHARDAVRAVLRAQPDQPVTVWIGGGDYFLTE